NGLALRRGGPTPLMRSTLAMRPAIDVRPREREGRTGFALRDPSSLDELQGHFSPALFQCDGLTQLLDRIVGVRTGLFLEIQVGLALGIDTEFLGGRVPFRRARFQRRLRVFPGPNGRAHPVDR